MCESVHPSVCLSICPRACSCVQMFVRTCVRSSRTNELGRSDSHIRPHARAHAHTRTHALMNTRMYEQTFGRLNMNADRQTDGWTDSHIRPHARAHAHTRTLACLHAHMMHSGTYARTNRHTYTCSYGCIFGINKTNSYQMQCNLFFLFLLSSLKVGDIWS